MTELDPLSAALSGLAAQDADEVLRQARAEARARVQAILTDALSDAMLAHLSADAPRPADPAPPVAAPPVAAPSGDTGLYVYGVIAAAPPDAVPAIDGIAGGRVFALPAGELAAVVSRVPLAEFDETALREHLGDMRWVEQVARGHETVLQAAAARTTLIPMRMCSIFRDENGVRGMLEREAVALRDALGRLLDTAEWGVKGFVVTRDEPATAGEREAPATGAGYLEGKRQERRRRDGHRERLTELCARLHTALAADAARAVTLPLQRPEASGHPGSMCFNAAYLVADQGRETFFAAFEACRDEVAPEGVELVLTGPWPAYNFVPDAIGTPA
ncbi:MAG TPA: GvpL/GvpF family gas vesicle protein [Solirubrobacteraceae bacterium]|nr:GvpL/GvpF family gas vesicle protein [Solirubrobacteraceae bacterium]